MSSTFINKFGIIDRQDMKKRAINKEIKKYFNPKREGSQPNNQFLHSKSQESSGVIGLEQIQQSDVLVHKLEGW